MALTIGAGGATALYGGSSKGTANYNRPQQPLRRPILSPPPPPRPTWRKSSLITRASKKWSPRTEGRTRRSSRTTTKEEKDAEEEEERRTVQTGTDASGGGDDGYFLPELPGLEKDFWEGPEWDGFGFFVQYMWAFGILFALIASGFAVATYNEGATDFKETPAYKESIQSRDLLEEPEGSSSDVFESNPTEEAPSLE